jgi:hypothetical protein
MTIEGEGGDPRSQDEKNDNDSDVTSERCRDDMCPNRAFMEHKPTLQRCVIYLAVSTGHLNTSTHAMDQVRRHGCPYWDKIEQFFLRQREQRRTEEQRPAPDDQPEEDQ